MLDEKNKVITDYQSVSLLYVWSSIHYVVGALSKYLIAH